MNKTVIKNASLNGKICNIECENGIITSINNDKGVCGYDADGKTIIPGLIEVHAHGCNGMDTLDGNFEPMCDFLARNGTTTWLPTTMTTDTETLIAVTHKKTDFPGTHIAGFHLEGPYISPKYKGAQNEAHIKAPSYEEFTRFNNVKMITIAPEQPGSMDFIRRITAEGVVASIGHSDANYDTSIEAMNAGVACLTHTFNRMPPLHHRDPGPIAAASEKGIWAQVITDGIHVHKSMILSALKMFGKDRLTLISDAIRPAGLPEGTVSESGGIPVVVRDGAVYLEGTDTLAGSGATLWKCVKYCVSIGISFEDAVTMATKTPAKMLGLNKGEIREGFDADLLIVNDKMEIEDVFVSGMRYE
ncbi:MAG: N-acetylglucosamine-6-phosphate deacetylase [Ruminococcaceae bacterium]|nr:N-acetylglucosamine-6-phosphate deacetylase [Oscillospiraceae bacterium]